MSTATFYVMMIVLGATFVLGALLLLGLILGSLRTIVAKMRWGSIQVLCPRSGQVTRIRVGRDFTGERPPFFVTQCERFGLGDLTCDQECICTKAKERWERGRGLQVAR